MIRRALETPLFDPSVNETIRTAVPDPLRPIVEAVTHLGDPATVLVVALGFAWIGSSRERGARVLAVALVAFAVTNGLKGVFVLERPVEQLAFAADDYGGYAFPSGHALGAAAVYGAVAIAAEWSRPRRRYAVAGLLIVLVALSRVVLGVHYVGDVVAGAAIGIGIAVGVLWLPTIDPGRLFALAGAFAAISYATPARAFMPATVGAALGAVGAWYALERRPTRLEGSHSAFGLAALAMVAVRLLSTTQGIHWSLELGGYAIAVAVAVASALGPHRTPE
ncbi:PA-phosphatase-like phosphoesterase [Natronococcus amylolyticus DSM 10524]|uniref:PA-phosphatase-like phosphoesterase n=1 Tax=Natronococcus amylolyticus DSM 10524 TaxID=1227497 RepID=L9X1Z9_9EURY|nr:phosphatase PAP2 family protein [Natronococcus amylolyticus]ELY54603.1 PA-phosphatase-like phosphoesterase [Natronococcus amylolyticus DSM 10524]